MSILKNERDVVFLTIWVIACGLATFAALVGYGLSQQVVRQLANEPQYTWVSDDVVAIGEYQADPKSLGLVPSQVIDPTLQLGTFVEIFDANNKIINTNIASNSDLTLPPAGVFSEAKNSGIDKVSWQLPSGQRFALVVGYEPKTGDYILSGRSLSYTEQLEPHLFLLAFAAWVLMIAITSITCFIGWWLAESTK